MSDKRQQIITSLHDKEYRDAYVAENIRTGIAFQVRVMRKQRGWTQAELGQRAGKRQEVISIIEDPNCEGMTLATLKKIASAFDVSLVVRFEPFSDLVAWIMNLSPDVFDVSSFTDIYPPPLIVAQPQGVDIHV